MWTTKTAWKPSNGPRNALNFMRPLSLGRNTYSFSASPPITGIPPGVYVPLWREFGRYPVIYPLSWDALSIPSMTNEELNLGEGDASVYKDVYRQVVKKFMW